MQRAQLPKFNFSVTIGFGIGFFETLKMKREKHTKNHYEMPNHIGLLDPIPYKLFQTDMVIRLGSSKDFVNRWVFESDIYLIAVDDYKNYQQYKYGNFLRARNQDYKKIDMMSVHDIVTAINDWVVVTDVRAGFQHMDGRNLMASLTSTDCETMLFGQLKTKKVTSLKMSHICNINSWGFTGVDCQHFASGLLVN
jgi:hypothetical protein